MGPRLIGYASVRGRDADNAELAAQAELIAGHCDEHGFRLLELVADREPSSRGADSRPALEYAVMRVSAGEADGLVVAELSRLASSVAALGHVIQSVSRGGARLVAAVEGFDSGAERGRLAADLLVQVSHWERRRLSERTRKGLEAARRSGRSTGRASVSDYPELRQRIEQMRSEGMTLQAIAERFNAEGVPTIRGGSEWRHSSLQAVAGYRRERRTKIPLTESV